MSNWRFTLEKIRSCMRESEANVVFLQEVVGENFKHRKKLPTGRKVINSNIWRIPSGIILPMEKMPFIKMAITVTLF